MSQTIHVKAPALAERSLRSRLSVSVPLALALGALGSAAGPAFAADEGQLQRLESALNRLEAQHQAELKKLQDEIAELKAQQAQTTQQLQQQQPPPNSPKLVESPTHQFGLSSNDGQNSVAILARLHFDAGSYLNTEPDGGTKAVGPGIPGKPLNSGIDARRARLGIGGTFLGDWAYRLIYDFGNSADSLTPGVSGGVTSGVENAYLTYNGFNRPSFIVPAAVDFGYLDIPFTLDEATSSNDIMFLERSSSQVVATQFGGGDFRSGLGLRSNNQRYWAGAYLTGPQSGAPHTGANDGNFAALGRFGYQIWQDTESAIHFGANAGHLFNSRVNSTTTSASSISTTAANNGLALSDRPELRIDPTVLLNTGTIPSHSGSVYGLEAAAAWNNFYSQGEYFRYSVDQIARGINPSDGVANLVSPTLNFQGGYAEVSYSFGGRRKYIPETGAYSGVIPTQPFATNGGGWGALELAARYSAIDLNDKFIPGQAPHLTGGVNGGNSKGVDVGLNWYPNLNVRFMLDYIHTDIDTLFKATTNGTASTAPSGTHLQAVALRSQFTF
ncbi:MAG TPA: porin [Rhodospirillaceae bacterium]|nr:porin [Rhodospirillaceae bacterium]